MTPVFSPGMRCPVARALVALLEATPGVAGIKAVDGRPLAIDIMDILKVRAAEVDAEVEFDRRSHGLRVRFCARIRRQILRAADALSHSLAVRGLPLLFCPLELSSEVKPRLRWGPAASSIW